MRQIKSRLCSVGYAFLYTRVKYPGITRTRQFCYFCTTFIPSHDSSVTSVTTSYRYPGMGYTFHTRTRGRFMTSVQHHTLPGGGLKLLYIIPYPGEVCNFCTTSYPTRQVLWLLYDFHTLTRQFCNLINNFVPVPGYGVHLSYSYPGEVCDFCTTSYPTRGRFVSSV